MHDTFLRLRGAIATQRSACSTEHCHGERRSSNRPIGPQRARTCDNRQPDRASGAAGTVFQALQYGDRGFVVALIAPLASMALGLHARTSGFGALPASSSTHCARPARPFTRDRSSGEFALGVDNRSAAPWRRSALVSDIRYGSTARKAVNLEHQAFASADMVGFHPGTKARMTMMHLIGPASIANAGSPISSCL